MTLIISIFLVVLFTELVSWVGKSVLLEFTYNIYLRIFQSSSVARQRQLKADALKTKQELLQTSAQDQFAKWAKLRRSVDKGLADLEKLNAELSSSRSAFSIKFNTAIWLLTTGLQFVIGWWYRKSAVFYLPPGWLGPLTWWMSLPFAPRGSVSCGVWQIACRRIIKVGEQVVRDVLAPSPTSAQPVPATSEKVSENGKESASSKKIHSEARVTRIKALQELRCLYRVSKRSERWCTAPVCSTASMKLAATTARWMPERTHADREGTIRAIKK